MNSNVLGEAVMNKKIVGVVNFSTLCKKNSGSFISSREKSWDEHVEIILNELRLESRLKFFTEVSLPIFDLQSESPDESWFSLVVLISDMLPQKFKNKLEKSASIRPWLRIEERGEDDWLDAPGAVRRSLNNMISESDLENTLFSSFRIDDDFISTEYLRELLQCIEVKNQGKFVTFSNGYKCAWDGDSLVNLVEIKKPLIAIGLAHVGSFDKDNNAFSTTPETVFAGMNHYELDAEHAVLEKHEPPMFIWSQHKNQDTAGRFKSVEIAESWGEVSPDIISKLQNFPSLLTKLNIS